MNKYLFPKPRSDRLAVNKCSPLCHFERSREICRIYGSDQGTLNAGKMKPERLEMFRRLLLLMEEYKRKNQYE